MKPVIKHFKNNSKAGQKGVAAVEMAILLPFLLRRVKLSGRTSIGLAMTAGLWVSLGPTASTRVHTAGLHRNVFSALVGSGMARVEPRAAEQDWRRSPSASTLTEDLSQFRAAARARNVVMILLESTGAKYLKPYGAAEDPMPTLSELARESILFENAYAVYPESIKGLFSVLCSTFPAFDTTPEHYERAPCTSISRSGHFPFAISRSILRIMLSTPSISSARVSGSPIVCAAIACSLTLAWMGVLPGVGLIRDALILMACAAVSAPANVELLLRRWKSSIPLVIEATNRVSFYFAKLTFQNAANYNQRPLAPGMLAFLYRLGVPFRWDAAEATAYPWPTELGDVEGAEPAVGHGHLLRGRQRHRPLGRKQVLEPVQPVAGLAGRDHVAVRVVAGRGGRAGAGLAVAIVVDQNDVGEGSFDGRSQGRGGGAQKIDVEGRLSGGVDRQPDCTDTAEVRTANERIERNQDRIGRNHSTREGQSQAGDISTRAVDSEYQAHGLIERVQTQ